MKTKLLLSLAGALVMLVAVASQPNLAQSFAPTGLTRVDNENSNIVSVIQEDTDGDGLLDTWETLGLTVTFANNSVFVDLPAMGATPQKKDIFVEIDYMVEQGICLPLIGCYFGHSHKPKPEATNKIVQSFANAPVSNPDGSTGITLHVDHGPDSVMNPTTGENWGHRSQSNSLPHDRDLGVMNGNNYQWDEFDIIKASNFSLARAAIFHYCIFAHFSAYKQDGMFWVPIGGISRGIPASDFIVSLADWPIGGGTGTTNGQAGTFMHELGHNLGLRHGGNDHTNYKPNFLSVMNYSFQFRGLIINSQEGHFDYSRFALPNLDESGLDETVGLDGGPATNGYGTRYYCWLGEQRVINANGQIDWNCNFNSAEVNVQTDINQDSQQTVLGSYNDWANLVFDGGIIGKLGEAVPPLPMATESDELTREENAQIITPYQVAIISYNNIVVQPSSIAVYPVTIANLGISTDTYTITLSSSLGWADTSHVPDSLTLPAGISITMPITVIVPSTATSGMGDTIALSVASQGNPLVGDSAIITTSVIHHTFLPMVTRNW